MSGNGGVTIPNWFMRVVAVCMPIIMVLAGWANVELRGVRSELGELRTNVAVLNVQMEEANKTDGHVEDLRNQIRDLQRVVDRLETQLGQRNENTP